MSQDPHDFLSQFVKSKGVNFPALDYLEVGVQEGHSLQVVLNSTGIHLAVGIDTWGGEAGGTNRGSPWHVTELLGPKFMQRVVLITGDSHTILRGLRHKFHVIFVDGDHSESGAFMDLEDSLPLLAEGGSILFDDIDHPSHPYLRKVAERFRSKNRLVCQFHDVGHGIMEFKHQ